MKTKDFSFDLPEGLIAQHPPARRGTSRLLVLGRNDGTIKHSSMKHVYEFVEPGSIMVFNNSRVRKARVYARSRHGGAIELLLIKDLGNATWKVLTSKTRKQRVGKELELPDGLLGTVVGEDGPFRRVLFSREVTDEWLEVYGHVPLPPYIDRPDGVPDSERYQTVYAQPVGSVAAPTAGLHFTEEILTGLSSRGIDIRFVTLHVGAGTFFPIRSEEIDDHEMHEEEYEISQECAADLNRAAADGRKIIAVGTTSVRCLESAYSGGEIQPGRGATRLFVRPGYRFRTVGGLFTNFHTPGSTLLVLVSAFAGVAHIRNAYEEAVAQSYKFFSYGDAMLIV
jgi:S-adenosylmethionine:tRNA ribosyltransferase-isomerase